MAGKQNKIGIEKNMAALCTRTMHWKWLQTEAAAAMSYLTPTLMVSSCLPEYLASRSMQKPPCLPQTFHLPSATQRVILFGMQVNARTPVCLTQAFHLPTANTWTQLQYLANRSMRKPPYLLETFHLSSVSVTWTREVYDEQIKAKVALSSTDIPSSWCNTHHFIL